MPDYFGEVRVMVVATQDNAYGSSEQAVKVKKPIMMMASLVIPMINLNLME